MTDFFAAMTHLVLGQEAGLRPAPESPFASGEGSGLDAAAPLASLLPVAESTSVASDPSGDAPDAGRPASGAPEFPAPERAMGDHAPVGSPKDVVAGEPGLRDPQLKHQPQDCEVPEVPVDVGRDPAVESRTPTLSETADAPRMPEPSDSAAPKSPGTRSLLVPSDDVIEPPSGRSGRQSVAESRDTPAVGEEAPEVLAAGPRASEASPTEAQLPRDAASESSEADVRRQRAMPPAQPGLQQPASSLSPKVSPESREAQLSEVGPPEVGPPEAESHPRDHSDRPQRVRRAPSQELASEQLPVSADASSRVVRQHVSPDVSNDLGVDQQSTSERLEPDVQPSSVDIRKVGRGAKPRSQDRSAAEHSPPVAAEVPVVPETPLRSSSPSRTNGIAPVQQVAAAEAGEPVAGSLRPQVAAVDVQPTPLGRTRKRQEDEVVAAQSLAAKEATVGRGEANAEAVTGEKQMDSDSVAKPRRDRMPGTQAAAVLLDGDRRNRSAEEVAPPAVRVTVGRVEVRVKPSASPVTVKPFKPPMELSEYLRDPRKGGR